MYALPCLVLMIILSLLVYLWTYMYQTEKDYADNYYISTYEVIPVNGNIDTAYVTGPYSYNKHVTSYDPNDYSKGKIYSFCGIIGIRKVRLICKNKIKPIDEDLLETNITFKNGANK